MRRDIFFIKKDCEINAFNVFSAAKFFCLDIASQSSCTICLVVYICQNGLEFDNFACLKTALSKFGRKMCSPSL